MQHILNLMHETCARGVNLIHDFVDHEFLESANVELNLRRTDLTVWIAMLLEEYQRSESHTHLHFEYRAPTHPVYANIDVNKFQQVINNLVSNAIKFTPDGGTVTIELAQQADTIRLTVAGLGMSVIQTLVHLHGGQVAATSQEGAGTQVTIELPALDIRC
jgi:two-component system sensor histidine kinase VicK